MPHYTDSVRFFNHSIETIFFDWGGVIASDPGDDFLKQLLRDVGANEDQVQEIFDTHMMQFMRGEISEDDYWDELRATYKLEIHDSISDEFMKWRGLIVEDSVFALVDEAKAQGLKVALFSNVIEPTYNALAKAGHYDRFDALIASCKVGHAKPEPEIYQIALQELQTTAEKSLFIDDKQKNLDPAAALGFTTVLAQNPAQIIVDVRAYLV